MADKFGGQKDGRQTTGATFYDVPAVPVNANALYFPNFPASPFFGIAEYPVAAGDLGAFSTAGVFVFDKPVGWIDNPGRKVFYRPKTAATGEIVAQEIKGDVFIGLQIIDNINPQKLGVLLASTEFCMNVLIVTSTADSGAGSLRQAIADASDGDVILFDSDVFPLGQTTSILLSSYITVNKSVSIYGGEADGNGGYTSGASKSYYVYRDVDGVKTKVVISTSDEAQEGEIVLFDNVCRVALDGQATQDPDATDEWTGWTGSRVMVIQQAGRGSVIKGLALCNGVSGSHETGALIHGNATIDDLLATFIDCAFVSGVNTSGAAGGISCEGNWIYSLSDCNICACKAQGSGGGVYVKNFSNVTFDNCVIADCKSPSLGGGVHTANASQTTLNGCAITNCSASYGGGVYSTNTSQNTLTDCTITDCNATSNGGGVYASGSVQNTLNDCIFNGCSAANGGGFYVVGTTENTLNNSVFNGCAATTSGGGVYLGTSSKNTFNDCTISSCTATSYGGAATIANDSESTFNNSVFDGCSSGSMGGGAFVSNTSICVLNNCSIINCTASDGATIRTNISPSVTLVNCVLDASARIVSSSSLTCNAARLASLHVSSTATLIITGGVTTVATAAFNSATITIADGAALTITTSATIGAATFTSDGRGYLAVGAGIDTSAATLTNVVACTYGAGLESFAISADGANWTAQDLTTPILIETRDDGGDWQTLTDNATGGEYATTFALESTARAFDGVAFFVASLSGYWQADASAVDANDWSVRGFAAANSNGGGDAQGDAAQGWTVTPSTVTPNADGV